MDYYPSYLQLCIVPFSNKWNYKSYHFMNSLFKKLGSNIRFTSNVDYNGSLNAIRIGYNNENYADIQYYLGCKSSYREYRYFHTYEDFINYLYTNIK